MENEDATLTKYIFKRIVFINYYHLNFPFVCYPKLFFYSLSSFLQVAFLLYKSVALNKNKIKTNQIKLLKRKPFEIVSTKKLEPIYILFSFAPNKKKSTFHDKQNPKQKKNEQDSHPLKHSQLHH